MIANEIKRKIKVPMAAGTYFCTRFRRSYARLEETPNGNLGGRNLEKVGKREVDTEKEFENKRTTVLGFILLQVNLDV